MTPTSDGDGRDTDANGSEQIACSSLHLEDAFFVLKDRRRKLLIDVLRETDSPTELGDIAEKIATIEVGGEPDPQERKRVYIALSQTHVDVLSEHDVIEHRDLANIVTRGPEFSAVARVLDAARSTTQEYEKE